MVTIEQVHASSNKKHSKCGVMSNYLSETQNNGFTTPRVNLRSVHGEGVSIAKRARGCMQMVIDPSRSQGYRSPRGPIRVASDDARNNQNKDRSGHMSSVMDRESTASQMRINTPRASRGVKGGSALENSTKGHEGVMGSILRRADTPNSYRELSSKENLMPHSARPQSYRPKSSLDGIMSENKSPVTYGNQRIKPEAQDNYSRSKGNAMSALLHMNSTTGVHDLDRSNSSDFSPPSRVRPEAAESAFRDRGSRIFKVSPQSTYRPRVKPEAEDIARKNRGTIANLMV